MPSDSEIKSALARVTGPDGRTPLPDSGAIEGITQRDGKVFIAIRVDPAQAASLGPMKAAVEQAIKALPGVASVLVTLTAEAAPAAKPAAAPRRVRRAAARSRASTRSSRSPRARAGSASPPPLSTLRLASPNSG